MKNLCILYTKSAIILVTSKRLWQLHIPLIWNLRAAEFGICKQQHASTAEAGGRSDGAKQLRLKQKQSKQQTDGRTSRLQVAASQ
jgi:hypothetical protein